MGSLASMYCAALFPFQNDSYVIQAFDEMFVYQMSDKMSLNKMSLDSSFSEADGIISWHILCCSLSISARQLCKTEI
jgi:hypothetical protein